MEQLTILLISRPHGTFKWEIRDGLVVSSQGSRDENIIEEPCPPQEFLIRNGEANLRNSGRNVILRAVIMTRHINEDSDAEKSYYWTVDERLDRTSSDIVEKSVIFDTENFWQVGNIKNDRIDTMKNGDVWIHIGGKRIQWNDLKEKVEG
jgi:hypothetical protein